jgi:hypothetical protein
VSGWGTAGVGDLATHPDIGEQRIAIEPISDVLGDLIDVDDANSDTVSETH